MQTGVTAARQIRTRHRYELRTLTYVTLDQANGGIVRNLTHDGFGAQVVAAVRPRQILRVRFELRYPRLRVEARGEVMWATFSGQCGIRFLDLSPRLSRQIDEWIFGNLLEGVDLHEQTIAASGPVLAGARIPDDARRQAAESDGLAISATAVKVIELPARPDPPRPPSSSRSADFLFEDPTPSTRDELDWLSRPLSKRGLTWTVNSLVIVAGLLLFALVFLFVTRELPRWPLPLMAGATVCVAALYWGFFRFFGGASPGTRLARLAGYDFEAEGSSEADSENHFDGRLRSNG
ncbi:MAG: PilZ domain-containing protein [Candidatus Sulfotelmatobacter sp.]